MVFGFPGFPVFLVYLKKKKKKNIWFSKISHSRGSFLLKRFPKKGSIAGLVGVPVLGPGLLG